MRGPHDRDTMAESLSYKDAGVDIDAGNALVERIKPLARSTTRPEVLGGIGGFAALCRIPSPSGQEAEVIEQQPQELERVLA